MGRHGLNCSVSGKRQTAGASECCNDVSFYINCGEFLYLLKTCEFLRMDFAPFGFSSLFLIGLTGTFASSRNNSSFCF